MTDIDAFVGSELDRLLPLPDGGLADWGDVVGRAGSVGRRRLPHRRTLLVALTVAVIGLLIAVPAFGLDRSILDWFSAPAAPAPAQKDFQELDIGAPAGMGPHVSGPARSVMEIQLDGRDVHFWVAPTASGGFCLELEGYGAGCDRDRQLQISWIARGEQVLFGDALPSGVDHMDVTFADGESVSIPVVHVSSPIDASFFVYRPPVSGAHVGAWPSTVEAVRSDGTIAASVAIG
jgi:hypothetical protein